MWYDKPVEGNVRRGKLKFLPLGYEFDGCGGSSYHTSLLPMMEK